MIDNRKYIPLNRPHLLGRESAYIEESLRSLRLAGDGPFTERCHAFLEKRYNAPVLLTHSCTAALEMSAMLADINPGDEVILPSFTFSSTANAFALRGARLVFVDIRPDTLNLDETKLEAAFSPATKAIVPVHYAGISCEMDAINHLAVKHGIMVIEDAAQAYRCSYRGKALGTYGTLAAISFHETKNVMSGEGGALIINDSNLLQRAYVIREKGTNRTQFMRQEVAKYEWLDIGSSYLPSDLIAAMLLAQLEGADEIIDRRLAIWHQYHEAFETLEKAGKLKRPVVPEGATHNGHIYYVVLPDVELTRAFLAGLKQRNVGGLPHYVPLHSAPAGRRFGIVSGTMTETDRISANLVRIPLHYAMSQDEIDYVIRATRELLA